MGHTGHLFVAQGDLTRLAADAFLVPCDSALNVSGGWRSFLEPGSPEQAPEHWFRPGNLLHEGGFHYLPDTTPTEHAAAPDDVTGLRVLVDTVGTQSIPDMVARSLAAVRFAAAKAEHRGGRALPLIAMPILGVGQGNFPGRRAGVISELVSQLLGFVAGEPIDVALVLNRTADFAAAQWARSQLSDVDAAWSDLSAEQRSLADDLGTKAARGELSIFVGAGASKPIGFPDWRELLLQLARDHGRELVIPENPNYPELAQGLRIDSLNQEIAGRFRTRKHALGHALLADLRAVATVTTNYDPCLENAAAAIHTDPPLRVLVRELAIGSHPWLLKLHGDVEHPDTIVLTTEQYRRLKTDHHALRGVVQTLMLTSHLLFVGFGFADDDFLAMSEAVQRVRALAFDDSPAAKVGTAIGLLESRNGKYAELDYRYLAPAGTDVAFAARRLEILLDRLTWRTQITGDVRAAFLLDPDFQQGAAPADRELRKKLLELLDVAERHQSAGSRAVMDLLAALGHR